MQQYLEVCYTSEPREVDQWLQNNNIGSSFVPYTILGIDVEWKPVLGPRAAAASVAEPDIALLQLATPWGSVLLFHVCHCTSPDIPEVLKRALLDPKVLKVGVGVLDDVMKIHKKWGVRATSYIDLVDLWAEQKALLPAQIGPPRNSLLAFAQYFTGFPNWKKKHITLSNWERYRLTYEQQSYAAMDAFAGAATFVRMNPPKSVIDSLIREVHEVATA